MRITAFDCLLGTLLKAKWPLAKNSCVLRILWVHILTIYYFPGFTDFIFPSQDESITMPIDVGDFDKEITFEDFGRSLLKGEVSLHHSRESFVAEAFTRRLLIYLHFKLHRGV